MVDPFTLRGVDLDSEKYWRNEFEPSESPVSPHTLNFPAVLSRMNLSEFIVLNVELCSIDDIKRAGVAGRFLTGMMATEDEKSTVKRAWGHNCASKLAEVEIARLSDFGKNDDRMIVRTHLGHLLSPGSIVLGYDLQRTNIKDSNEQLNECLSKVNIRAHLRIQSAVGVRCYFGQETASQSQTQLGAEDSAKNSWWH